MRARDIILLKVSRQYAQSGIRLQQVHVMITVVGLTKKCSEQSFLRGGQKAQGRVFCRTKFSKRPCTFILVSVQLQTTYETACAAQVCEELSNQIITHVRRQLLHAVYNKFTPPIMCGVSPPPTTHTLGRPPGARAHACFFLHTRARAVCACRNATTGEVCLK
jgi:hypothetical protein